MEQYASFNSACKASCTACSIAENIRDQLVSQSCLSSSWQHKPIALRSTCMMRVKSTRMRMDILCTYHARCLVIVMKTPPLLSHHRKVRVVRRDRAIVIELSLAVIAVQALENTDPIRITLQAAESNAREQGERHGWMAALSSSSSPPPPAAPATTGGRK